MKCKHCVNSWWCVRRIDFSIKSIFDQWVKWNSDELIKCFIFHGRQQRKRWTHKFCFSTVLCWCSSFSQWPNSCGILFLERNNFLVQTQNEQTTIEYKIAKDRYRSVEWGGGGEREGRALYGKQIQHGLVFVLFFNSSSVWK